eukprot:TRINITY_DN6855_c0_g1_i1.p2 TRINITY_DN6855_c0_g1~~TRINITY_DN6855_c0_g1_i1.p2  ORF type:complete len:105 (-),score=1.59 TRINITY_DN6855_c0_g1_i1:31-345(-)
MLRSVFVHSGAAVARRCAPRAVTFASSTTPAEESQRAARPAGEPIASAMELIARVPVTKVKGRNVHCDGGGGALGHPRVFICLEKPGPHSCEYCGLRFEQEHHH